MLDEAARRTILSLGEGDFTHPRPGRALHQLFETQARATPGRLALEFREERVGYRELDLRADAVARALRDAGVVPGEVVGVWLDRSPELIVALLGILKSGAAFLPLDRSLPHERLRFMLDETRTQIVVTRKAGAAALEALGRRCVFLDPAEAIAGPRAAGLDVDAPPDALAYVLYTSGSTGRPKGVMVPHRALVNHMLWMLEAGLIGPGDRALQKTPITFDVALWECLGPLLAGATVVLAEPDAHRDPRRLVETIAERNITVTGFVPSMLRHIVEEPAFSRCGTLRRVFSAGEALPLELARRFAARSRAELYNLYGPTETAIHSTAWRYDPASPRVLIGRPISHTRIYVLDDAGGLAPFGVAGELCIGGAGVALGYVAREELTAAAFVPDPFRAGESAADPHERIYRTGDLVRLLPDGTLECLGRRDRQLKLRGLRIEPGEIEAVIGAHPDVREAAVAALESGESGPLLTAFVAMRSGTRLEARTLSAHAATQLPDYMIPALWTSLPELPRTSSGKIDYHALPAFATYAPGNTSLQEAPATGVERRLARIWERLLGVTLVRRDDNFSELGGHSLLLASLALEIEREFGKRIPLEAIGVAPTLAQVALAVEADNPDSPRPVTAFNGTGSQTPFIFFHNDLVGGGAYCRKIADALGPDQPFYAIAPQAARGLMLDSIEAMASDYLPVVRSIQPRGPYRLGGFCDGGFVAYEITTSLLAQGERVEHLILINTPAPSARIAWIDGAIRLVGRQRRLWPEFRRRFAQILALRLRRVISAFSQGPSSCLRALRDQIELVSARPIDFHGDPATSELEVALGVVEHTYHPRPCASPLTLMWGEEEYRPILHDDTMGWGALVRSVTVIPIPGDHLSGIRRACALIAERLRYEFSRDTHHIEACDKISVS